jgi:outer membrane protein assembly factor BamB
MPFNETERCIPQFIKQKDDASFVLLLKNTNLQKIGVDGKKIIEAKLPLTNKGQKIISFGLGNTTIYATSSDGKTYVFDADFQKLASFDSQKKVLKDFQCYELSGKKVYFFIYDQYAQLVNATGKVIVTNIATKNKVVLFYSSSSRSVEIVYAQENNLYKQKFALD